MLNKPLSRLIQLNQVVYLILILFTFILVTESYAKRYSWLSPNDYRILLTIEKSQSLWSTVPVLFSLDMHKNFKNIALSPENLSLPSIRVVAYDMKSNPLIQQASKSGDEKYFIPYRLDDNQFPNQISLSWRVNIKNVFAFAIYFDQKGYGLQESMKEIPVVGNGDFLSFGERGVIGPISGGYNEIVAAGDGDGDGDLDLFVGFCGTAKKGGIFFFENVGTASKPLLQSGRRINLVNQPFQLIDWDKDGVVEILIDEMFYKLKLEHDHPILVNYKTVPGLDSHSGKYMDWDNDGLLDRISCHELSRRYYPSETWWDPTQSPYSSLGVWMGENTCSRITLTNNIGSLQNPNFAEPETISVNDVPVELYGTLHITTGDWDGDRDLDLIAGNSFQLIFFENIGDSKSPQLAQGIILKTKDGQDPFSIYARPELADWDGDGDPDILLGNEDGRPTWIENLGDGKLGTERFLLQMDPDIDAGCCSVPVMRDWDADGDMDIVCGNSTGFVEYFENKSNTLTEFIFSTGQRLEANNKEIRIFGLSSGSIQGPDEAKYGYTMPEVVDWDGDGDLDLLLSDIKGEHYFYKNIGDKKEPKLAEPSPLLVDWPDTPPKPSWVWWQPGPTDLVTPWRCRPSAVDWDQNGLIDYIAVDHDGYLAFYQALIKDNQKWLRPGVRIFLDQNGCPFVFPSLPVGNPGELE